MTRNFGFFIIALIFVIGIAIGTYYYVDNENKYKITDSNPNNSIQDIVIREIQASDENIKKVDAEPEKISPYAKIIIEKYFNKCNHTTSSIIDVPKELINLTEDEFREKYNGWTIRLFTPREIQIYKEFNSKCSEHFVVKEKDGFLAIYNEIVPDNLELKEITNIDFNGLREEDKKSITAGVNIYGRDELSSFIEDFDS
jgi:hypothetical protein